MRLDNERESSNVEDRRGSGGLPIGGKGIGIGTVVIALVAMYFGVDPSVILNGGLGLQQNAPVESKPIPADDPMAQFVAKVLASTEDTWTAVFAESNQQYRAPKLVLFSGQTPTACGSGQAAMGPFYCPGDQKVYIDLNFYQEMKNRFNAPGDFAYFTCTRCAAVRAYGNSVISRFRNAISALQLPWICSATSPSCFTLGSSSVKLTVCCPFNDSSIFGPSQRIS